MQPSRPRQPSHSSRTFFLRGLAVLLPSVLTLWLLVQAYRFIDSSIAAPINEGIRWAVVKIDRQQRILPEQVDPTPSEVVAEIAATAATRHPLDEAQATQMLREQEFANWWRSTWYLNLVGLLVAVVAVWLAGRLVGGFLGRQIHRRLEGLLTSVPVVKHIYPHVKQVVDFLLSDDKPIKFNRVIAIEYPRKGIWSLGLVTGEGMKSMRSASGDAITVFIPSSPTPFTGYTITVPKNEAIELDLSIDEALRFVVTAGVLAPTRENPAAASLPSPGKESS